MQQTVPRHDPVTQDYLQMHQSQLRGNTKYGSVTLVLLPLKYEIDDSVTVTVVLLGEARRCCTLMGGT